MLYRKIDHALLWLLLTPALAYTGWTKWAVVHTHTPLAGWPLWDFVRLQMGYYGLLLLWCACLLRQSPPMWLWRLVVIGLTALLTAADVAYSLTIFYTGALAPFDVGFYMGRAIDRLSASIPLVEWLTLGLVPALVLGLALLKCRQRRPGPAASVLAILLLACTLVPPLAPSLELNTARPAYVYQVVEFLRQRSLFADAAAQEPQPTRPMQVKQVPSQPRNLVIIVLESVGAGATAPYNPERADVTPFLQELAKNSWLAQQAYAVTPHTSKALVAINCGQQPYPRHPIFESTYGLDSPCLAHVLKQQGYRTAFFQSPTEHFENRRGLVNKMGFDDFVPGDTLDKSGFQLANYFGYEDDILLKPSQNWLQQQHTPFFAFYLTGATHHPYWVPERYGIHPFDKESTEKNRYLNAVHYLDNFTRNLMAQYRAAGLYDNTLFVIVGDHGESLGEHNRLQHNASLYQEVMQVPLLIHGPGMKLKNTGGLVSQLDILPSALQLLGFTWQGETEGLALAGTGQQRDHAIAGCWYDNWCLARNDGRYKYIYNFNQKGEEVYDLRNDPQEQLNIAQQMPQQVRAWREELLERHQQQLLRWHHFLARQDEDYWDKRGETLGSPAQLLQLALDDPRRER